MKGGLRQCAESTAMKLVLWQRHIALAFIEHKFTLASCWFTCTWHLILVSLPVTRRPERPSTLSLIVPTVRILDMSPKTSLLMSWSCPMPTLRVASLCTTAFCCSVYPLQPNKLRFCGRHSGTGLGKCSEKFWAQSHATNCTSCCIVATGANTVTCHFCRSSTDPL
jgi:hypothetical protein